MSDLVPMRLVPIEIFGENECCEHGGMDCPSDGYGLSDAVSAWSDCNRAVGRIYRIDDPDFNREPGDTVTIYVRSEDVAWFERRFGADTPSA